MQTIEKRKPRIWLCIFAIPVALFFMYRMYTGPVRMLAFGFLLLLIYGVTYELAGPDTDGESPSDPSNGG